MEKSKVFAMKFSQVYPLYIAKAEKKGRTKAEVDKIIIWLTGYDEKGISSALEKGVSLADFFDNAPFLNPNHLLVRGKICTFEIEEIEDPLMRILRVLDKLIDDLAKGKDAEKLLI